MDHLDRELRVDPQVLGLVEARHAALAEHARDPVRAAEHRADQRIAAPRCLARGVASRGHTAKSPGYAPPQVGQVQVAGAALWVEAMAGTG